MTTSPATSFSTLIALLEAAGYPRADTPLLQPADVFLDLSGEDIRRRLYLTQDATGQELCLRPEFTIPLCVQAVDNAESPLRMAMSYCGPVFRHRTGESGEFLQAGVESLGRVDTEAADAEVLALAIDAARHLGSRSPVIRMGDAGLINGVLEELAAPVAFARRLKRRLAAGRTVQDAVGKATGTVGLDRYAGVMSTLEGAQPEAVRAFVGDMLTISGVRAAGGRSTEEIAERFLAKARQGQSDLGAPKLAVLEQFLSISGHPDEVAVQANALARANGLDLSAAVHRYEARLGFMAARGIDLGSISASVGFVRNLDYYTGMVFEIVPPDGTAPKPLVGGGRYDNLLKRLGAQDDVPAVGFSIWLERFDRPVQGAAA